MKDSKHTIDLYFQTDLKGCTLYLPPPYSRCGHIMGYNIYWMFIHSSWFTAYLVHETIKRTIARPSVSLCRRFGHIPARPPHPVHRVPLKVVFVLIFILKWCKLREYKWNEYVTIAVESQFKQLRSSPEKKVFGSSMRFEPQKTKRNKHSNNNNKYFICRNKTQTAVINIINLRIFNVYHRCLCFISDQATMAQDWKDFICMTINVTKGRDSRFSACP